MDPSEIQADKGNDTHSLEQVDEKDAAKSAASAAAPEASDKPGADGAIDATGGVAPDKLPKPEKTSPLKKFWRKFNLYLMLFILVVVVAVGILAAMVMKSNQPQKNALDTQNLSQQELQQLANTDVTVGNP